MSDYWQQLADRIEKAIPDQAQPHGLFLHPVDWKHIVLALKQARPEGERVEHLQMQLGYLATKLMLAGDTRSLPEIVGEAEKATSPQPQKGE